LLHSAWPFANAVKAGASAIMCSYNRVNGSYGCQNSKLLNGVLKEELGFQGYGKIVAILPSEGPNELTNSQ